LPAIDGAPAAAIITALNANGYVVRSLIEPTRHQIVEALHALAPAHMNFVYMCGYGTSTLHYPVSHTYECLFVHQKEDYLRACIDWDCRGHLKALKRTCDAGMADLVAKREAALAAKRKKKKGAILSPRSPATPRPGAATPAPRRGISRAAAAAEASAAAAAAATQVALQLRDTEYGESQTRGELALAFNSEREALLAEFAEYVASVAEFERLCVGRRLVSSSPDASALLPSLMYCPKDVTSTMPFEEDTLAVADIMALLFRRALPPSGESFAPDCPATAAPDDPCRGLQSFLAIDLVPATDGLPRYHGTVDRDKALAPLVPLPLLHGAAVVASSTGHAQHFFFDHRQRLMMSWHLRKALLGHIDENWGDRAHPDKVLAGAVTDGEPGQRDVPSILQYLSKKLEDKCQPELQPRMRTIGSILESYLVYYGDVLPVRKEVVNHETRQSLSKQAETKRVHSSALIASKPERGAGELQNELQAHLSDLQTVEVVPQFSLLVTFLRQVRPQILRTLDHIDLDAVRQFIRKSLPRHVLPPSVTGEPTATANSGATAGYVTFDVSASALGLRVDFAGLADKNKLLSVISGVAVKLTTASFPASRGSSEIAFTCDDAHDDGAPVKSGGASASLPAAAAPTYDVNDVEALYVARGITNAYRFKKVVKRWVHKPLVGTSVRLLAVHGHSTVDNSTAGISHISG